MPDHGGARPGAGRPSNAEKHREAIAGFTDLAAGYLGEAFLNLQLLAEGGAERVEARWAPAGTLTRKDVARDADDVPLTDKNGRLTVVEILLYPDLPADELVMVERKTVRLPPEFRPNEFLVNRVMGTPIPAPTPEPELLNIRESVLSARSIMAARKARPPESDEPPPVPASAEGGVDDDDDD